MRTRSACLTLSVLMCSCAPHIAPAPDPEPIQRLMAEFYTVLEGRAGEERDWRRMEAMFADDARMLPTVRTANGQPQTYVIPAKQYMAFLKTYFESHGFQERELARRTESFGAIAHVFSTYEAREDSAGVTTVRRGINSIQLGFDGTRWLVHSVMWDDEQPGQRIPDTYLRPGNE